MKKISILIFTLMVPFLIMAQDISYVEYFFDNDPGFNQATSINLQEQGANLTLSFDIETATIPEGWHHLGIRAKNSLGKWGPLSSVLVYLIKAPDNQDKPIVKAEYFIDTDPGFGLAKPVTIASPANYLTLDINESLNGIEQGMHHIGIRAADALGRWGNQTNYFFYCSKDAIGDLANITQLEYYFDTDPGFGNGTPVDVATPGKKLTINFDANLTGLSNGDHMIYIRAKNALNQWGYVYAESFNYTITGIGQMEMVSLFKLFPNPSKGDFKIQFSNNLNGPVSINIKDIGGKTVYYNQYTGSPSQLSLSLPSGIYLISIENGAKKYMQKICID